MKPRAASIRDSNIAVVTVNYRTPELTKRSIAALAKERERLPGLRAVVVDGGSGDGSAEELAEVLGHPDYAGWVEFLPLPINGGFGWANNQAMLTLARKKQQPEYVHLLNPDTEVMPGAVSALVEELRANPDCGAAGSLLIAPDGQQAASAFRFPSAGREFVSGAQSEALGRLIRVAPTVVEAERSAEVDWVTGASVMFRTSALRATGLFDDGFFLYFEEVELMHRLRAVGWTVRHVPASRVVHLEGAATGMGSARPLPGYWYKSRRRYFALTGGAAVAGAANVAWASGRLVAMAKKALGRFQNRSGSHTADLLRFGLWPRREDRMPSVPAWGDAPGKPPAWMTSK
jgi:N-acetylglucosaminyl-diphospho-decaprenol L-rhamnosyltransferase